MDVYLHSVESDHQTAPADLPTAILLMKTSQLRYMLLAVGSASIIMLIISLTSTIGVRGAPPSPNALTLGNVVTEPPLTCDCAETPACAELPAPIIHADTMETSKQGTVRCIPQVQIAPAYSVC